MSIWIKPNGSEIEINDTPSTIKMAEQLGWKPKQAGKRKAKKKESE